MGTLPLRIAVSSRSSAISILYVSQSSVVSFIDSSSRSNMGRHEPQSGYLWEKALAKGYKLGAHRAEDSKTNTETYVPKTLKDQNGALKRYEK